MVLSLLLLSLSANLPATDALKAREAEIRKLLPPAGQPLTPPVRRQVEKAMVQIVDLDSMAKQTLGDRVAGLSPAKRKAFFEAFSQRFTRASGEQVDSFRSNPIRYLSEQPGDAGLVNVPTQATVDDEPTQVVYVMRPDKEKGGWRIADVVIDGVSTVENFKKSFSRVIGKEGIDGLIARLKKEQGSPRP